MNKLVCALIESLQHREPGSQVVVCGGYARDVFFNRKPKDVDIFVHLGPGYEESQAFNLAEDTCAWARSLGFRVGVSQAYGQTGDKDMRGEAVTFDERHYAIAQLDLGGLSIDVLFTRAPNVYATLRAFDANINQVYLHPIDGPTWLDIDPPTELRFLKAVTTERRARVLEVAKELRIHEG